MTTLSKIPAELGYAAEYAPTRDQADILFAMLHNAIGDVNFIWSGDVSGRQLAFELDHLIVEIDYLIRITRCCPDDPRHCRCSCAGCGRYY